MPEMHFTIEWPDGAEVTYYSPSYVVEEELAPGAYYPLDDFLARIARALRVASERVRARYGFACSAALDELARIEATASTLARTPGSRVRVVAFEKHAPRDARATSERERTR